MPASLSASDRHLLERAVLAPHELSAPEQAAVRRLTEGEGPGRRFRAELESFYGAVEASYVVDPAPRAAARRLARRLVPSARLPRAVRLRVRAGGERPGPYVLQARAAAPSRFVPVATLVGDGADLVVRLVQDVAAGACVVYVVASPAHRAHALLAGGHLEGPVVTDGRGRGTLACPEPAEAEALDGRLTVHPALGAGRVEAAALADGATLRVEAEDGGAEAARLSLADGVLRAAPVAGRDPFRWLVLAADGEAPRPVALRDGRAEVPWAGAPATVRGHA